MLHHHATETTTNENSKCKNFGQHCHKGCTFVDEGKLEVLTKELNNYKIKLAGITETDLDKMEYVNSGYHIYKSGRSDGINREGVALVLKNTLVPSVRFVC